MILPSRVGMIFAQSLNKVIGRDNQIPSEFPSDLAYFKEKTLNSTVIMGRKTWESLPRKPLPGRKNVVLTSQKNYPVPEDVEVISDIEDLEVTTPLLMFIGGTSVYELAKRYETRNGGYTRLVKLNERKGDDAMQIRIELV